MNNVKYGDITVAWHKTAQNLKKRKSLRRSFDFEARNL